MAIARSTSPGRALAITLLALYRLGSAERSLYLLPYHYNYIEIATGTSFDSSLSLFLLCVMRQQTNIFAIAFCNLLSSTICVLANKDEEEENAIKAKKFV